LIERNETSDIVRDRTDTRHALLLTQDADRQFTVPATNRINPLLKLNCWPTVLTVELICYSVASVCLSVVVVVVCDIQYVGLL